MNKILFGILIFAFVIRLIGLDYGIPQRFVGDEFVQVAVALKMLEAKSFIPNFPDIFYHQPLSAYISLVGMSAYLGWQFLTGQFESLAAMKVYYAIHSGELLIVPRFLAALLGMLAIYFIYLAARDLFNKRIALTAAFFAATDFLLVYIAHAGRVWSYMPFFIALALWASVKLYKEESWKNYLAVVGSVLLAAANLLPGIFIFAPTFINRFGKSRKLWASVGILSLGVLLILFMNPRGLGALLFRFQSLSGSALVEAVAGQSIEYTVAPTPIFNRIFDAPITLFNYSPIYFILFFVGGWLLWRDDRRKAIFLLSFPAIYYLFIGPFFGFGWVARALGPLAIYLAIFSAYAVEKLFLEKAESFREKITIVFATALIPLFMGFWFDARLLKEDSREQALNWLYQNLPENSRVLVYSLTNEIVNQNRAVLDALRKNFPKELDTRQRTLLAGDDALYPSPKYFAWDARDISLDRLPKNFLKNHSFQYYVITDWQNSVQREFEAELAKLLAEKKLLVEFNPFGRTEFSKHDISSLHNMLYPIRSLISSERMGPAVRIYEVKFK